MEETADFLAREFEFPMLGEKKGTQRRCFSTQHTKHGKFMMIYDNLKGNFCLLSSAEIHQLGEKCLHTQKTYKISCWFRNMESFWALKLERHVRKARCVWGGLWVGIGIFDFFTYITCRWRSIKKRRSRWRVIESVRSDSIVPDIGRYPSKCREILHKISNVSAITWRKCEQILNS